MSGSLARKIGWTLLTGFVGFTGSNVLDDVLEASLADQLIITVVAGGVALLVQYLLEVAESERAGRAEIAGLGDTVRRGFASVNEATELVAEIGRSAVDHDVLEALLHRAARITGDASPLVRLVAGSETRRLTETLQALAAGQEVFYDGEDREFLLTLARGTTRSLDAICWAMNAQGEGSGTGFWLSDLGARYLDLQRAAVRRGVVVRRIFIVESAGLTPGTELSRIVAMQRSAGIQVRLLDRPEEAAQDGGVSDYLVFDGELGYVSTPVTRREVSAAPWQLTTRLLLDARIVGNREHRFAELWESAQAVPSTSSI
ncbi:DUF6879 family protein [Symbioplanes lichenis]|uniref:DUF6879 family protein n=1 Tax=Symbioplanes lichenis TaxID=1629072 RepID=UPI00273A01CA|nr:DUF6879 family protein [Actinoplanes lichenis]